MTPECATQYNTSSSAFLWHTTLKTGVHTICRFMSQELITMQETPVRKGSHCD